MDDDQFSISTFDSQEFVQDDSCADAADAAQSTDLVRFVLEDLAQKDPLCKELCVQMTKLYHSENVFRETDKYDVLFLWLKDHSCATSRFLQCQLEDLQDKPASLDRKIKRLETILNSL